MTDSLLLTEMFKTERWNELIKKAEEKGLDRRLVKELCRPDQRQKLYHLIAEDKYNVFVPRVSLIPKDKPGEFREVYINTDRDRIVLSLINDCLCDLFGDMIHPQCKSYQKGIGTQSVVKEISKKIVEMDKHGLKKIGYKSDFSKYFDKVKIEVIDSVFDILERRLGYRQGSEPVINLLRRYYHQDLYFDNNGVLKEKYQALKQGCAVASFLANVCLYDLDAYMSEKYEIYYRYSDDLVVIDRHTDDVIKDINKFCEPKGVTLNPKKVEALYVNKWFKFLGFNIKGCLITLSKNRVKRFQHEIENRTIKKKKCTAKQAKNNVIRYLYEGDRAWATSCLATINVERDIIELNNFIMDCIRACETGKKKIGGLGSCMDRGDYTIVRGKGKNVRSNKNKTNKEIVQYISMNCLSNDLKIHPAVYECIVRSMSR